MLQREFETQGANLPFLLHNMLQPLPDMCFIQWREAESRAAGLEGRDNLANIVANEAEASVASVLLNYCRASRSRLIGIPRHTVPYTWSKTHGHGSLRITTRGVWILQCFITNCKRCYTMQNREKHATGCRWLEHHSAAAALLGYVCTRESAKLFSAHAAAAAAVCLMLGTQPGMLQLVSCLVRCCCLPLRRAN